MNKQAKVRFLREFESLDIACQLDLASDLVLRVMISTKEGCEELGMQGFMNLVNLKLTGFKDFKEKAKEEPCMTCGGVAFSVNNSVPICVTCSTGVSAKI